jgi:arylsulfatase A-like enzyme
VLGLYKQSMFVGEAMIWLSLWKRRDSKYDQFSEVPIRMERKNERIEELEEPNQLSKRTISANPLPLILTVIAAIVAQLFCAPSVDAESRTSPNIIVFLADDMGFSDAGCYGGEIATPNLDRLAANGIRFTQMYNASKCFPSRACLLTGCYAQQVGMARKPEKIINGVTIGEVLRPAGYRTLWTGKHHATENPFDRGFDRFFGLRDGACNYFNPGNPREGEPKPAQKRSNRSWCIDGQTYQPYTPPEKDFYTTDYFTNYALEYLDQYRREDNPFFLYISYNAPHDPLQAWPEDIAKYKGKYEAGWQEIRDARYRKQMRMGLFGKDAPLSPREPGDWSAMSATARAEEARRMEVYAAMIDRMDQNIGRIINKIEELGELEDTLIIFVSDNGGSAEVVQIGNGEIGNIDRWSSVKSRWANVSNTPFRKYKNYSHEGGVCTPCIMHWPSGITTDKGSFVRTPAHFIDLMATFIEAGQAEYPSQFQGTPVAPMQGVSLMPLLRGERLHRPNPLFWQWSEGKAIRLGKWKAVSHGNGWELFDMEVDRTELVNLAGLFPDRTAAMIEAWESWYAGTPAGKR